MYEERNLSVKLLLHATSVSVLRSAQRVRVRGLEVQRRRRLNDDHGRSRDLSTSTIKYGDVAVFDSEYTVQVYTRVFPERGVLLRAQRAVFGWVEGSQTMHGLQSPWSSSTTGARVFGYN